jgi:hypothetical protein
MRKRISTRGVCPKRPGASVDKLEDNIERPLPEDYRCKNAWAAKNGSATKLASRLKMAAESSL